MYWHIDYNSIIVIAIFQHGTATEQLLEGCLLKAAMLIPLIDPLNHLMFGMFLAAYLQYIRRITNTRGVFLLGLYFRVKTLVQWHFPSVSEAILNIMEK